MLDLLSLGKRLCTKSEFNWLYPVDFAFGTAMSRGRFKHFAFEGSNRDSWVPGCQTLWRETRPPRTSNLTLTAKTSATGTAFLSSAGFAPRTGSLENAAGRSLRRSLCRTAPRRRVSPTRTRCPNRGLRTQALLLAFTPSDFEIQRIVGQQGYATITDWEYYGGRDPLAPTRTIQPSEPAVRLYEARITSSFPRLYNARVMLKEFLKDGIELGVNEAEAYKLLYEADGSGIDPDTVPVATLLGTFITDESFESPGFAQTWARRFPKSPNPPQAGAPFLVFRWEGIQTGLSCATSKDTDVDAGTRLFDGWFPGNLIRRKATFLRNFMANALDALLYLHATGGIVHRSMGLASIMVNTTEYRLASSLMVKIRDLGFAKPVSALVAGEGLEKARKAGAMTPGAIANFYFAEDVYALGYAFLELVFSVYSGRPVTQDKFKTLFEDTFRLDIDDFRQYCKEDPDWSQAVEFLDSAEGAGWATIQSLLSAREKFAEVSLQNIRSSSFFEA